MARLRTRTSRTYLEADGSYQAEAFTAPVNYQAQSGTWLPIDDTLVSNGNGSYRLKADGYDLSLPSELSGSPVVLRLQGHAISFQLQHASGAASIAGNQAEYYAALSSTDLTYTALSTGLKEELTLHDPSAPQAFTFALSFDQALRPSVQSDGSILFSTAAGQRVFAIPAPFMQDATGATSTAVRMTFTLGGPGRGTIELQPDASWLSSAARQWPVVVDPTVTITYNGSSVVKTYTGANQDCYLQNGANAGRSLCNATTMLDGYDGSVINRSLLQFNISIQSDATVLNADLGMYVSATQNSTALPVEIHQVTQAWTTGANWNTADGTTAWTTAGGTFNSSPAWTNSAVGPSTGWYHWYLSQLVQGWIDGSITNSGLLLKAASEGTTDKLTFRSSEYSNSSYWPYLKVTYQLAIGKQGWYHFQGRSLSDHLQGNVQVANGNWLLTDSLFSIHGTGHDENLQLAYNNLAPQVWDFGRSWVLNTGWDVWLRTNDGDGISLYGPTGWAAHFIANSNGTFQDALGIDAALTHNGDGTYTVTFHSNSEQYNFSSTGALLLSDVDRDGNRLTYSYDANGALSSITDTQGRVTTFSYISGGGKTCGPPTASGFVGSITDPASRKWSFTYDSSCDLTTITDPANNVTTFTYDANTDQTQVTDPLGHETKLAFDSAFRITSVTYVTNLSAGTGLTYSYTYNSGSTAILDPNQHTTTDFPDGKDRLVKETSPRGASKQATFNADDKVASATDPANSTTSYGYGANNEVTTVTYPDGTSQTLSYQDSAHPYSMTSATASTGVQSSVTYNAAGHPLTVSNASNPGLSYTYNSYGEPLSVTDARGNATTYTYDTLGNLTKVTYPAPMGAVTCGYDSLSRLTSVTDGRGHVTTYSYDVLDHLLSVGYDDSTSVQYTYDSDGNRTKRVDSSGTSTWAYDLLNRLTSETSGAGASSSYTYDSNDNVLTRTDRSGTEQLAYNADNQLTGVTDPAGHVTTIGYDSAGRQNSIGYPNGVTEQFTYDSAGLTTNVKATNASGTVLKSFSYGYVNAANQTVQQVQNVTDAAGDITTYSYDSLGQLTSAVTKTSGGVQTASHAYAYDPDGNITSITTNGSPTTLAYNAADEITQAGSTTYSSDGTGNVVSNSTGLSITYNAADQASSIIPAQGQQATSMAYAGTGQTYRVAAGGTSFTYDASGMNSETASGATTYFIHLPNGAPIEEEVGSNDYYYLHDAFGSVVGLTDSSANVVDSYQYDPFGNIVSSTEAVTNPLKWVGAIYDAPLGLYKIGNRYYSPSIGRFLQPDPAGRFGNAFGYALNDPINLSDRNGDIWAGWRWWGVLVDLNYWETEWLEWLIAIAELYYAVATFAAVLESELGMPWGPWVFALGVAAELLLLWYHVDIGLLQGWYHAGVWFAFTWWNIWTLIHWWGGWIEVGANGHSWGWWLWVPA